MKTSLLLLSLLATFAFAQTPVAPDRQRIRVINPTSQPPAAEAAVFADNYLVSLSVTENEVAVTELGITTARPLFTAETFDPAVTFSGTLELADDGTMLVSYALGAQVTVPAGGAGNAVQYKSQTAQAQVRLKLGEPLNILRAGQRTYRLTVVKLPAGAPKEH